jgi:hypothetical protein
MIDWKRIIVGNAFRLPSRDLRYYLELALIVPLFFAALFLMESLRAGRSDLHQTGIAAGLVCLFLLLIKDHIRVIAEVLYTLAFLVWWHYAMHGDRESLRFSLFFILGLVLTISVGAVFRAFVLQRPINPMYYHPDKGTSVAGIVLVLGSLFALAAVGIAIAYR